MTATPNFENRKALQGKRIKIFTRSFSLELYLLAKKLFEDMGVPVMRLTDQNADGYFFTMLKDKTCDIAVNIDEDAFVANPDAIWDLAEYVVEGGYANAGCPDGGSGAVPRDLNPIVTNPFFNILNLELIRTLPIKKEEINRFDYNAVKEEMIEKFPKEILLGKYNFDNCDFEPYYPFFLWLARNFKTLYLPAQRHKDGISTILYNHKHEIICCHSWFARFYNVNQQQTKRINALIDEVYTMRNVARPLFTLKNKVLFSADLCLRWLIKIPMRIVRWPKKWAKWYRHYKEKK